MRLDTVKASVLVTVTVLVQLVFVNDFELGAGRADVLLLVLVCVGLLRGPVVGAALGFWAGLLFDIATLDTLGLSSLVLTVAGYAAGRIGESTSDHEHQRARVLIAVAVLTTGTVIASLVIHLLLGNPASVSLVLGRVLLPTLLLNLVLAIPAFWAIRKLLPPPARRERVAEVIVV